MVLLEVTALHLSAGQMDGHTWVVFAIALGPALLMMIVVALRIRQDARDDARDDVRAEDARRARDRREAFGA